jgi:hypothetical protein
MEVLVVGHDVHRANADGRDRTEQPITRRGARGPKERKMQAEEGGMAHEHVLFGGARWAGGEESSFVNRRVPHGEPRHNKREAAP